jgi:hypothetical protein
MASYEPAPICEDIEGSCLVERARSEDRAIRKLLTILYVRSRFIGYNTPDRSYQVARVVR